MVPLVASGEEKKPAHALVVQSPENPCGAFCLIQSGFAEQLLRVPPALPALQVVCLERRW